MTVSRSFHELEVINDVGSVAFGSRVNVGGYAVAGRCRNREDVAHTVQLCLLQYGEAEFAADLVSGKVLYFAASRPLTNF